MLTPREIRMIIAAQKAMSKAFKPLQSAMIFLEQKRKRTIRLDHILPKREELKTKSNNKPTNGTHQWYNRPIGIIGIIIIGTVLSAIIIYLLKHYLNLPL